tara:strand:+ start:727 stop:1557 length:831 start_codon:yes stop_codon:yes gene_type:complete
LKEKYRKKIARSFDSKSKFYDNYSIVQKEIARRMIGRLSLTKINPLNILDLGSGTGYLASLIAEKYPSASVTCLDISEKMILECKKKNNNFKLVISDIEKLPFNYSSFDLVVSSFTLHWCEEIDKIFFDIFKILKDNGLFMFTTVGPSTLKELQEAYANVDDNQHINSFTDLHLYGDSLLNNKFQDPVMDMEEVVVEYRTFHDVLDSLRKTGANTLIGTSKPYTKKSDYIRLLNSYPINKKNKLYPVTYEMIYGFSWKNHNQKESNNTKVIPIKKI